MEPSIENNMCFLLNPSYYKMICCFRTKLYSILNVIVHLNKDVKIQLNHFQNDELENVESIKTFKNKVIINTRSM